MEREVSALTGMLEGILVRPAVGLVFNVSPMIRGMYYEDDHGGTWYFLPNY